MAANLESWKLSDTFDTNLTKIIRTYFVNASNV